MGHLRLGSIPKTHRWSEVLGSLEGASDDSADNADARGRVAYAAAATLKAAQESLGKAPADVGVALSFLALAELTAAARGDQWEAHLRELGIFDPAKASIFDVCVALTGRIDDKIAWRGGTTDLGEIAQRAVTEALTSLGGAESETLFGNTGDAVRQSLRKLSTKAGFGRLGQAFFGTFLRSFLNFYISRVTAGGVGRDRNGSLAGLAKFNDLLSLHCFQTAAIVRDFSGQWYSKALFEGPLSEHKVTAFVAIALKKLRAELVEQAKS
jgi:hypothetical protein